MKKQTSSTKSERQLKFAEAGVLFVLVLGITIFVGTKMASKNSTDEAFTEVAQESVVEITGDSVTDSPIVYAEPVAPVESSTDIDTATMAGAEETSTDLEAIPPRIVTYALSEQAYFAGEFDEAADMFSTYSEEHPGNAWGHYMLGLSSWKAGDTEAAEVAFIAALDIRPDHTKSLINYGRVLLELDRPEEARSQLEAALAINPENLDANRVLGRVYHNLGMLEEAATSYRTTLEIKIDDIWALNNLGLIRIEQERFQDALPPLAKAAQLNEGIACIQNNLGVALERNGFLKESAIAFERALASDDEHAKAGKSLERIGTLAIADDQPEADLDLIAASFTAGFSEVAESVEIETEPAIETLEPVVSEESIEVASGDEQGS